MKRPEHESLMLVALIVVCGGLMALKIDSMVRDVFTSACTLLMYKLAKKKRVR